MKVLPLLCKWLDPRVTRMTTSNGRPVSSRRRKNSVLNQYFRAKFIDTQREGFFFVNHFYREVTFHFPYEKLPLAQGLAKPLEAFAKLLLTWLAE